MPTEMIELARIDWPGVRKEDRTHDREFVRKLALSIEAEGMHQAIVVRPDPAGPGRYLGVIGWHRAAAHDVLKRDMIEARVALDMDEEEAQIARVSENLFRNPLSKPQQARAIARWHDDYDRKRKEFEAAGKTQVEAGRRPVGRPAKRSENSRLECQLAPGTGHFPDPAVAEGGETTSAPSPAVTSHALALPAEPPANFAEHVGKMIGKSPRTIKRSLAIGRAFTPDQLEAFHQCRVGQESMEKIARFDEGKREAIVGLITNGMEPEDAIAKVAGTPEVAPAAGRACEVDGPAAPGEEPGDGMTNEEWTEFHCVEILKLLPDPTAFRGHAALYRAIRDDRQTFKAKTKKPIAEAKAAGLYGGICSLTSRIVNLSHPKHWLLCGSCKGEGITVEGDSRRNCRECSSNGFVVKIESS